MFSPKRRRFEAKKKGLDENQLARVVGYWVAPCCPSIHTNTSPQLSHLMLHHTRPIASAIPPPLGHSSLSITLSSLCSCRARAPRLHSSVASHSTARWSTPLSPAPSALARCYTVSASTRAWCSVLVQSCLVLAYKFATPATPTPSATSLPRPCLHC
ncbi:hypothetical protein PIB30_044369 [Stylosanthes scabra]|uniref:Uncharacterized protein n=1 Tax=Stylosanthes scabra TaxID=79078 RepID=A0ABU6UGD2_9FABA|nr:hypothetical protein [Stylosanthes scabra]